jgi:hypothetical protein
LNIFLMCLELVAFQTDNIWYNHTTKHQYSVLFYQQFTQFSRAIKNMPAPRVGGIRFLFANVYLLYLKSKPYWLVTLRVVYILSINCFLSFNYDKSWQ